LSGPFDAESVASYLPFADSGPSHTIDIIDLESDPFELSCADFLHTCTPLDTPCSLDDNGCLLSDSLCLFADDSDSVNPSYLVQSLQSSLSADVISIGSIPTSPLMTDDEILALVLHDLGPAQRALHALNLHLHETQVSQSQYYSKLLVEEPTMQGNTTLHGHMDGGAQASTTDRLDYLFHYRSFSSSSTTLKVADNTPHYPVGMGFLRLPAHTTLGYVMVPTFYTPTLPATILSPSELGDKLRCQLFTCFTSFDNANCSLTLHHRWR